MKTQLVLHVCCAPDEAWVVKSLQAEYDLFCFFCNPNIQPNEEYEKRLEELQSSKFLTEEEKIEEVQIKKLKLALKDEMQEIIRRTTS